jgi:hypothetical protein
VAHANTSDLGKSGWPTLSKLESEGPPPIFMLSQNEERVAAARQKGKNRRDAHLCTNRKGRPPGLPKLTAYAPPAAGTLSPLSEQRALQC